MFKYLIITTRSADPGRVTQDSTKDEHDRKGYDPTQTKGILGFDAGEELHTSAFRSAISK